MPFQQIKTWLAQEKTLGSTNPDRMVLATTDPNGIPHCRIVAIHTIFNESILFFTQLKSRKAQEIKINPNASATIWLPLQQREVIIEGKVAALSTAENQTYWNKLTRDYQLRFRMYAIAPNRPIHSMDDLNRDSEKLSNQYINQDIPMNDAYCGYQLIPNTFYFYTLGTEFFSEYVKYELHDDGWTRQLLCP